MSKRILVVEDDLSIRETLIEFLEGEGYLVSSSINGHEALKYLEKSSAPDVILMDLMMPVMDGHTFLKERLKSSSLLSIPTIVMSAEANALDKVKETQIQAFLAKPLDLDEIINTLGRVFKD